jgi:replicative DNA helicase
LVHKNIKQTEEFAKNLNPKTDMLVGYSGYQKFTLEDGPEEDLYDISINNPHWYYTSGIVSHNSIVICNNAAACVKMGLNVLHVTCELSWYKTACRYLGIFSKVSIKDRFKEKNKKYILDTIKKISRSYNGSLAIYEFPPDMINIRTISALIDTLKKTRGWVPDVIAVDYLELLLSENEYFNRDEYKRQKKVSTEIRQLAKTTGTYIITATQTNRSKDDNKKDGESDLIDVNRVSESFGKMMPADYVVSINQSRTEYGTHTVKGKEKDKKETNNELDELEELELEPELEEELEETKETKEKTKEETKEEKTIDWRGMRLYIAKNRNGPKFKMVKTIVNFNNMLMTEATEGETK